MRQGRRGAADGPANTRMYDRFIVCHVRTVLDLKKDKAAQLLTKLLTQLFALRE